MFSVPLFADLQLPAELIYVGNCQDGATKEEIKKQILKYLNGIQDDIDRSICPGKNCRVENIAVVCGARKRRETPTNRRITRQTSYVRVTFNFATPFDLSNSTQTEAYNRSFSLLTAIRDKVSADVASGKLDISGFTLADKAFQTSSKPVLKCPPTHKKDGFKCSTF